MPTPLRSLRPRLKDFDGTTSGNGSIRLRVELANELIMPLASYEPLMSFVDECVQADDDIDNFTYILRGFHGNCTTTSRRFYEVTTT